MNSPATFVLNKSSRYIRRFSSVEGTLMLFSRFSIVPELSSAARIPLPGATSFLATDSKFSVFIVFSQDAQQNDHLLPCKMIGEMQPKSAAVASAVSAEKCSAPHLIRWGHSTLQRTRNAGAGAGA